MFTRISRPLRSDAHVRVSERRAAFVAAYTPNAGAPSTDEVDPVMTIALPGRINGSAFCTVNKVPLKLIPTYFSNCASVTTGKGANSHLHARTAFRSQVRSRNSLR